MTVSPLILILLSLGCGVFLGVIGLAVAQGLQKQPIPFHGEQVTGDEI